MHGGDPRVLCDECGQREASIHLTKILNDQKVEKHLCAECAREKGEFNLIVGPHMSISSMLSGLFGREAGATKTPGVRCEVCGMTFNDFGKAGRLGCGNCYTRFEERLDPVMRSIHGSNEHQGKVPKRAQGAVNRRKEIDSLRAQLEQAIRAEAYEHAAVLRDKIRDLEQKGKQA